MPGHATPKPFVRVGSFLLRAAVVVGCFAYIFHDLDLGRAAAVLAKYRLAPLLVAPLYVMATLLPPALRLRFLMGKRLKLRAAYQAIVLGLGLNVVLPARLGEIAKALYASDQADAPAAKGFGMVFWERLFDLQALCAMAVVVAALYRKQVLVLPLAAVVAGIWLLVLVQRRWPRLGQRMAGLVPTRTARGLAREFLDGVAGATSWRFFLMLSLYTLFTWLWYPGVYALVLNAAAGMHLDAGQVILVFLTAALGAAIPSSPGALGVYEASVYVGLAWCGVGKEEAVAAALALRCLMFLPLAVGGVLVLVAARINLGSLRMRFAAYEEENRTPAAEPSGAGKPLPEDGHLPG